jgi:mannose-6-phosphate isomerase-like protein (cupin superfamily)
MIPKFHQSGWAPPDPHNRTRSARLSALSSSFPSTEERDMKSIDLMKKFDLFTEQWSPKVIAEMNDYQFKIAKLEGDFIWHVHADTDETFMVLDGELRLDFRDGHVLVPKGHMYVVPKNVEHNPFAEHEVKLLLIEPRGVVNTGAESSDRTQPNDVWI